MDRAFTISDMSCDEISKMRGYRPPLAFPSDGCTMAPDEIGPVDLRPACLWHDWGYQIARDRWALLQNLAPCEKLRREADRNLYHNMIACGASPRVARFYYYRVRLWGFIAMGYDPPVPRLQRIVRLAILSVSRYFPVW